VLLLNSRYHLKNLEKTQWYSREEIEKLQEKKLKFLLENAYKHVPYYHKLFDQLQLKPQEIQKINDLPRLSIQRRETIKNDLDDLIATNVDKRKLMDDFTSGTTTGERLEIKRTLDNFERGIAAELRAYTWYGIDFNEKFYYLTGGDFDIEKEKRLVNKLFNFLSNKISLNPLEMTTKTMNLFIEKIKRNKRRVLYGSPSSMCRLANYLEEKELEIDIEIIMSTDNMLLKQQRKYLQDFFDCQVYDIYGTSEILGVAFECNEHAGYHLTSENVVMEIVDNDGEHVTPGERGKVLLTDLNNHAMPFIRYDIGDIGILSDSICSCGRGLHLVKPIDGQLVLRNEHFVYSADKEKIFLPEFSFLLEDFTKISQFQIIQKNQNEILLRLIKGKHYTKNLEMDISHRIKSILDDINIEFDYVDEIKLDRNGEHKFILREMP
jgi:phenylacetate-CoA ligase